MTTPDDEEEFALTDSIDTQILMHRDAHFGGKFEFMLDYYNKGGKGIHPEFRLERICELAETEHKMGQNLSPLMLTGADAEKVAAARAAYKSLRDLYETKSVKALLPQLIADLILAEEEEPESEIAAIVAQKSPAVPFLIDLLRSPEFADPLFPGYGLAPALAVKCLGAIGDKRALISLFEAIGEGDFFNEDLILDSLKSIGEPAKEFLLKVLHGRPLNYDNERAAIALERFKEDPAVGKACLEMLFQPDVNKDILLSTYLALNCEALADAEDRRRYIALAQDDSTSKSVKIDMQTIIKGWKARGLIT